jgi:hypothetical protein
MNALTPIQADGPTIDGLLVRAIRDHDAITDIAYARNVNDASTLLIAARALQGAMDDWCDENGAPYSSILPALRDAALTRLVEAGIDARAAKIHADIAAEYEANGRTFNRAAYMHDHRD